MKKYFGYGDLFCWHCGRRQQVGRFKCPHCGAMYNHVPSEVKYHVNPRAGLGNAHPSIIRAHVGYILFSVLFAGLWCCLMYFWMKVHLATVYIILWAFWALWLLWYTISNMRKVRKARATNKVPGPVVVCGYCGHQHPRHTNYCTDCGCVIPKPSTEESLAVNPNMNTKGVSPAYTASGKRRKKKKTDWKMVIFWTVLIVGTLAGLYVKG